MVSQECNSEGHLISIFSVEKSDKVSHLIALVVTTGHSSNISYSFMHFRVVLGQNHMIWLNLG